MNTMIYSPSGASAGIGFAVPVDRLRQMVLDHSGCQLK
jgi:S1-C subfamily serine protease